VEKIMRRNRDYVLLLITCFLTWFCTTLYARENMVLAVHPYLPVPEIEQRFTPLVDYLQQETGVPIKLQVAGSYDEHIKAIADNRVDIAFLGPVGYVTLVEAFGPRPILARFEVNHQPYLYGVIADSAIDNLVMLKDKRFAFGDPESTMSHVVPRYMLLEAGIPHGRPGHVQYLGSHHNVALGVLMGDFDAGAMKKEVFDEFAPKGLRLVQMTPGVPDHVFVVRGNMPESDIARLRNLLLALKDSEAGRAILHAMHKQLTALVPVSHDDYRQLQQMVRAVEAADQ
jgi:phosphonate transport system substrate-binding protein